jgi:hypothetical protein
MFEKKERDQNHAIDQLKEPIFLSPRPAFKYRVLF